MGGVPHAARYTRRVTCRNYQFDRFRLDPATRELYKDSDRIILPGSAFDCLVYLVEHSDRAVGRDELISAVWGRTDVSDTQLSQAVVRVRRALGDTGGAQTTIRTIPRFGYRWVAETRCNIADDSFAGELIDSPQAEPSAPGEASPLDRTVDPLPTQRGNEQPQRAARRGSTRGAWLATLVVVPFHSIPHGLATRTGSSPPGRSLVFSSRSNRYWEWKSGSRRSKRRPSGISAHLAAQLQAFVVARRCGCERHISGTDATLNRRTQVLPSSCDSSGFEPDPFRPMDGFTHHVCTTQET